MSNILNATITPKTVIDKLFDLAEAETINSELLECYLLFVDQFDASDPGTMNNFKEKLIIINNVMNFITELEKHSGSIQDNHTRYTSISSPDDFFIFPRQGDKALQDLIEAFYLNYDAKTITFEIWDHFVSAIGNDCTKNWPARKYSDLAFITLHLNTCLSDLECFKPVPLKFS